MRTLLMIGEYAPFREAMEFCLPEFGYDVLAAADVQAGCEIAAAFRVEIVLLDVDDPRRAGPAACRRIATARNLEGVPIIMLSWPCTAEIVERARSAGAAALVSKPFLWPDLLATMDRLVSARETMPAS